MTGPELPPRDLTDDEVGAFHADGAVCIRGILPDHWVADLTDAVDHVLANPGVLASATVVLGGGGFSGDAFLWKTHETFRRFLATSPAARLAQRVLGSRTVTAFYDQVFAKPAGNGAPTPFHEDVGSWPIEGDQVCTFWVPLDPCTPDTGALRVVRGSHRWERRFRPVTPGVRHAGGAYDDEVRFDEGDVLNWDLDPGDFVVFHPRALHGASGTGPDRGRRAFASRWVGDDVVFRPQHAVLPLLWAHGLSPGDRIGGPLFPRILPEDEATEVPPCEEPDPALTKQFLSVLRLLSR